MNRNKKLAFYLAAGSAFCSMAIPARAQRTAAPVPASKPTETPGAKTKKAEFQVLRMMVNAIQVQSLVDLREIHTFTYSERIRGEMQNLLNRGGYQYGDKVKIVYEAGNEIALNIKGKPSKPL
jgi:hypothetical protein